MEKIYIGFVNTPGFLAHLIRRFLKADYVHVVLGLDEGLREAYSVGRRAPEIPVIAGFERENLPRIARKYPNADYKVVSLSCTREQKEAIEEELHQCFQKRFKIHYAVLGLLFVVLGRPFHQENHYTCSSFLAKLLSGQGVVTFAKHFSLVTPKDFYELTDIEKIYEGKIGGLLGEDEAQQKFGQLSPVYRTGMSNLLGFVSR